MLRFWRLHLRVGVGFHLQICVVLVFLPANIQREREARAQGRHSRISGTKTSPLPSIERTSSHRCAMHVPTRQHAPGGAQAGRSVAHLRVARHLDMHLGTRSHSKGSPMGARRSAGVSWLTRMMRASAELGWSQTRRVRAAVTSNFRAAPEQRLSSRVYLNCRVTVPSGKSSFLYYEKCALNVHCIITTAPVVIVPRHNSAAVGMFRALCHQ